METYFFNAHSQTAHFIAPAQSRPSLNAALSLARQRFTLATMKMRAILQNRCVNLTAGLLIRRWRSEK
jgi:hypothetical protein